jgi:hypothetical protein
MAARAKQGEKPKRRVFTVQVITFMIIFASIAYFIGSMDDESNMLLHRYAQLPSPVFKLRYFFANVFQRLSEASVPQDYRMSRSVQLFAEAATLAKFAQLDVAATFAMREHGKQLLSCAAIRERVLLSKKSTVDRLDLDAFCRFLDYASALTLLEKHIATQQDPRSQTTVYALSYYGAQLSSEHPESLGATVALTLGDAAMFATTVDGLSAALEGGQASRERADGVDVAVAWLDSPSTDAANGGHVAQALFDAGANTAHGALCFVGRSSAVDIERRVRLIGGASTASVRAIAVPFGAGLPAVCDALVYANTLVALGDDAVVEQLNGAAAAGLPTYIVEAVPRQHFNHVLERSKFAFDAYMLALSTQPGAGVRDLPVWHELVGRSQATLSTVVNSRSLFTVLVL